jgi:hypothetical protein
MSVGGYGGVRTFLTSIAPSGSLALLVAVSVGIAGCALLREQVPVSSADGGLGQERVCHDLPADVCDRALTQTLAFDPLLARSPRITVAAAGPAYGDDLLVAVAPFGEGDMWSPAVLHMRPSAGWAVDYWKVGAVPPHFVEMMIADGIGPP